MNDQREHPSSSLPLMFLSPGNSTCVTDIGRSVRVSRKLGRVGRSGQPLFGERPSNVVNLCSVPETRAELRGGHHALGRHLPYMATHPTRLREMCMREIAISWGGHPTRLREICTREIAISWGGHPTRLREIHYKAGESSCRSRTSLLCWMLAPRPRTPVQSYSTPTRL